MTKQTYDNYYREYYHKNKDYILKRTKSYRIKYGRKYYTEHREEILAKRRKAYAAKKLQKQQNEASGIVVVEAKQE